MIPHGTCVAETAYFFLWRLNLYSHKLHFRLVLAKQKRHLKKRIYKTTLLLAINILIFLNNSTFTVAAPETKRRNLFMRKRWSLDVTIKNRFNKFTSRQIIFRLNLSMDSQVYLSFHYQRCLLHYRYFLQTTRLNWNILDFRMCLWWRDIEFLRTAVTPSLHLPRL